MGQVAMVNMTFGQEFCQNPHPRQHALSDFIKKVTLVYIEQSDDLYSAGSTCTLLFRNSTDKNLI